MRCYFCEKWFDRITYSHFRLDGGLYRCPHEIEDNIKHLKPYTLSKSEEALERAYDKNR